MREVAIVGAGELGGMVAHAIARRHVADVVRLVDDRGRTAEGKALDIMQAAGLEGFATAVAGSLDLSTTAGAPIIVIADRADGREWQGDDDGLLLLKRLTLVAPQALVVCAGGEQRGLIERATQELRLSRTQIVGSAPEAFVTAARAIVALELDTSPHDVRLALLGVPPSHTVIVWEDATVGGFRLTRVVTEAARRQLERRIRALWPLGPWALASAASLVVQAMSGQSRRSLTCFVAPDNAMGLRTRTAAVPVTLGPEGIVQTRIPELSVAERVALDNAMRL